MEELSSIYDFS